MWPGVWRPPSWRVAPHRCRVHPRDRPHVTSGPAPPEPASRRGRAIRSERAQRPRDAVQLVTGERRLDEAGDPVEMQPGGPRLGAPALPREPHEHDPSVGVVVPTLQPSSAHEVVSDAGRRRPADEHPRRELRHTERTTRAAELVQHVVLVEGHVRRGSQLAIELRGQTAMGDQQRRPHVERFGPRLCHTGIVPHERELQGLPPARSEGT